MMKKYLFSLVVALSSVSSYAQSIDLIVTDGRISFSVRGSGGFVCSAQDAFKKIPVLGRGETRAEAEMNAKFGASVRAGNGGDMFFSKLISCESSASGRGQITMVSDSSGTRIQVIGPHAVQCISTDTFKRLPFIANAGTQTEAYALAMSACAANSGDSGFFCKTECAVLQAAPSSPRVRVRLPRIRFN